MITQVGACGCTTLPLHQNTQTNTLVLHPLACYATPMDQLAALEARATICRIGELLGRCDDRTRSIFIAREIYGYSYKEIGRLYRVSQSRVGQIVGAVTAFLQRRLAHDIPRRVVSPHAETGTLQPNHWKPTQEQLDTMRTYLLPTPPAFDYKVELHP